MSRRFQFSLKTLLVATAIAAAFFAGMAIQRQIDVAGLYEYRQWREAQKEEYEFYERNARRLEEEFPATQTWDDSAS